MLKSRNLVQPEDFSIKEIDEILDLAQQIMANPDKYSEVCKGKLLATLFYEPSTRTRLSFESAMKKIRRKCCRILRTWFIISIKRRITS